MLKQKSIPIFSLAILLALIFAAVMPFAALADDETPPADPPVVEPVPPADEAAETAPVTDAPAAEEQPAADAAPAAEEQPAEETPAADLTIPEALEQLPEDASLIVVDETGTTLPLASQAAADAIATADPYFTGINGVYGFTSGTSCPEIVDFCATEVANPIQTAIDVFGHYDGVGNIYVEAGTYTENISINGNNGLSQLTGLIGAGTGLFDNLPADQQTILNGSVNIYNMRDDFIFKGFVLNGSFTAGSENYRIVGNNGDLTIEDVDQHTAETGISVFNQNGNVNLENVSATGNMTGIIIDDRGLNGSVTGVVTLTNVIANNNFCYGADFSDFGSDADPMTVNVFGGEFSAKSECGNTKGLMFRTGIEDAFVGEGAYIHDNGTGIYNGDASAAADAAEQSGGTLVTTDCSVIFEGNSADVSNVNLFVEECPADGGGETPVTDDAPVTAEREEEPQNPCNLPNPPAYCGAADGGEQIVPASVTFSQDALPGELPAGNAFVAGFEIALHRGTVDGERVSQAEKVSVTVDIPADAQGKPIRVLFWNGSAWVEVAATISADGRQITFTVAQEGKYAVVAP